MSKLKTVLLTASGLTVCSGATYAQNTSSHQIGMAIMRLNSSIPDQTKQQQVFGTGSLWGSLRRDFRMAEVNPELIRRHESKFIAGSAYFDRVINRSKPYMYHIAAEVKKRNMPAEAALLPFIESAFVTKAKSHVGASGLWQFMPATGRHYGLEKTPLYDGRHDVYAATDAALNYLQYLHGLFGDWSLAFAAYNWGEGNVGRAINRARAQGLQPTYENLRMPNETRNYVPKLLAVRNIIANPQSFGISISEISDRPYFQAVDVDTPIDHDTITRLAGISQSELLALNPAFNVPAFIPKSNRKLLLPAASVQTFQNNYRNAAPDTLFSWEVYTAGSNTGLSRIAAETGMSVAEIKRLNNLNSNTLSSGRSILVAKNNTLPDHPAETVALIDTDNVPDTYRSNMPANSVNITLDTPAAVQQEIQSLTTAAETAQPVSPSANTAAAQPENRSTAQNTPAEMPSETLAAATQAASTTETAAADELMQLVETAGLQRQARDSIASFLSTPSADAGQYAARPQINKRQARLETRVAKAAAAEHESNTLHAGIHRVIEGDTLFSIAKRYNVSVADLIVANNIKGNTIRKGQVLHLAAQTAKTPKAHADRVSYTARKGDTLNSIAARFKLNVNDIRRLNPNLNAVNPGQRIKLIGS